MEKNMNWKNNFHERIPLVLYKRETMIFFSLQVEVVQNKEMLCGYYHIYESLELVDCEKIGETVLKLLHCFEGYADLTEQQFFEIKGVNFEDYEKQEGRSILSLTGAKNSDDLNVNYLTCLLNYEIDTEKYSFELEWVDLHKRGHYPDFCPSTGDPKYLTFDTPLEFHIKDMTPERMGKMVLEAFERCEQIGNIANRKQPGKKRIELLNGARLSVPIPKDRHFNDEEDADVGEVYQAYFYYPHEDSDSLAVYYLGIAAELYDGLNEESVRKGWGRVYGNPDFFEMKKQETGIFSCRIEMKNKEHHRISYMLEQEEDLILECTMDVFCPNRRKKLDEKLSSGFQAFAEGCRFC